MKNLLISAVILTASLYSSSDAFSTDARSFTVNGLSLGMSSKQIISKLSAELDMQPTFFEYQSFNIASFMHSDDCDWMQSSLSMPACIGYRIISLNQGDENYTASAIYLYQRFEAPIDGIALKKKIVEEYGLPDYANVSLDEYDQYPSVSPAFFWSDEAKNASPEVLAKMRDFITRGKVNGAESAWLRIILNTSGRQIHGMMISLTDQKELRLKEERAHVEWKQQQAEEAEAALNGVKFK